MGKLRVSFSLLDAWSRGDTQLAIDTYFHVGGPKNKAMEYGIEFHDRIAKHIDKYNQFPDDFFSYPLMIPEAEKKVVANYNELFDISAVFDCIDSPNLFEFKTGVQPATTWARKDQLPLYFLVAELEGIPIEKAYLIHYNQHSNEKDYVVVWNTPDKVERARNIVDSYAPEIHSFFESEGLI